MEPCTPQYVSSSDGSSQFLSIKDETLANLLMKDSKETSFGSSENSCYSTGHSEKEL
jgi:hypothetical protein